MHARNLLCIISPDVWKKVYFGPLVEKHEAILRFCLQNLRPGSDTWISPCYVIIRRQFIVKVFQYYQQNTQISSESILCESAIRDAHALVSTAQGVWSPVVQK